MGEERAKSLIAELDAIAREYDHYDYGLPSSDDEMAKMVAVVNEFVRRSIPSQWSREPPTVPGLYWCRSVANNSPATVYEIIPTRRGLRVQTPEGDIDELYSNVEWCGPLPEPK